MKLIFFDLEGPLSPQDNAYELMKLFSGGERIFEVISRYDDLLTLEGKPDYEPGDTLSLIAPFLVRHGVREEDIVRLGEEARLVDGAPELISWLQSRDWQVFCISTSYQPYAHLIARRVGIRLEQVACTRFPLDRYRTMLSPNELALVDAVEQHIIKLEPDKDDAAIKVRLDRFFWKECQGTSLGRILAEIKPIGGRRKVEALSRFARASAGSLREVVVVGDSITDFKMLQAVRDAGGLAIAFNANEYALPYATMGLASTSLLDLEPVLDAWERGGIREVEKMVRDKERTGGKNNREYLYWLLGRADLSQPLQVHKRIRRLVREEAGKLG